MGRGDLCGKKNIIDENAQYENRFVWLARHHSCWSAIWCHRPFGRCDQNRLNALLGVLFRTAQKQQKQNALGGRIFLMAGGHFPHSR